MNLKTCVSSFVYGGVIFRKGDLVDASDPIVTSHADKFADPQPTVRSRKTSPPPRVEQATAAPGEKRSTPKPPAPKASGSTEKS